MACTIAFVAKLFKFSLNSFYFLCVYFSIYDLPLTHVQIMLQPRVSNIGDS